MATTTNYGWTTPDDTALVKDGASAIRSLGTSVDTTTKNLNPSTTLGDIEYRSSTANTNTRLGIGSAGQVLTVAAGVPSWATAAAGTRGLQQIIPTSVAVGGGTATVGANGMITVTSATTNISINGCFTSTYTNYKIVLDMSAAASYTSFNIRMRVAGTDNTTASSYRIAYYSSAVPSGGLSGGAITSDKWQTVGFIGTDAVNGGELTFYRPFLAEKTAFTGMTMGNAAGDYYNNGSGGNHTEATSYDGFSILTTQTLTGRILIYGWSE